MKEANEVNELNAPSFSQTTSNQAHVKILSNSLLMLRKCYQLTKDKLKYCSSYF